MTFMDEIRGRRFDWRLILVYALLVAIGIMNIYSSVYAEGNTALFSLASRAGMQLLWAGISAAVALVILFLLNPKIYDVLSWFFYAGIILLLVATVRLGVEVGGSKSWIALGPVRFQPAELSKITTALMLSSVMSRYNFKLSQFQNFAKVALILLIPMALILLERETGSMLVYAGFVFVLYLEGMSGWIIAFGLLVIALFVITLKFSTFFGLYAALGICMILWQYANRYLFRRKVLMWTVYIALAFLPALLRSDAIAGHSVMKPEYWLLIISVIIAASYMFTKKRRFDRKQYYAVTAAFMFAVTVVFSVDIVFNKILQPHQRVRIESLLGIKEDIYGVGYNVHQSKIAIGSGGLTGKGFLDGTQTKYDFVPEQSTDFIFCTIGEEWGFAGSLFIILLYIYLIRRIVLLSSRSRNKFTEIYGYCVAAIIFMHFFINIGMTIGLVPVIGIPLPFISYGGTSLLSFTALLFIFIRLESDSRKQS